MTSVTQAAGPRRRMAAADRREAILAAALDAFAEGGYHETSLDDVAERAGISKALIYEHFPSKRDLHGALLETYVHELLATVVEAIAPPSRERQRLRAGLDAFLAFVEERREAWRMLVLNVSEATSPPASSASAARWRRRSQRGWSRRRRRAARRAASSASWRSRWSPSRSSARSSRSPTGGTSTATSRASSVLAIAMDFMWLGLGASAGRALERLAGDSGGGCQLRAAQGASSRPPARRRAPRPARGSARASRGRGG